MRRTSVADPVPAVAKEWPPTLLLTVAEAAGALRVGRTKVFELLKRGDLQGVKIDGVRRIVPESLSTYVAKLVAEAR